MRTRSILLALLVLVFLSAAGYLFVIRQADESQRVPAVTSEPEQADEATRTMKSQTTKDGRVTFLYPSNWYLEDTTGAGEGRNFQSFQLQNLPPVIEGARGGILKDAVKIDISIETGGQNLPIEELVDCGMKTTRCEKIGIDNEQFIRAESTLNSGVTYIELATFYDDKILRFMVFIAPGSEDRDNIQTVNKILNSITFTPQP